MMSGLRHTVQILHPTEAPSISRLGYFASGSGLIWKCITLLVVPLPVSMPGFSPKLRQRRFLETERTELTEPRDQHGATETTETTERTEKSSTRRSGG